MVGWGGVGEGDDEERGGDEEEEEEEDDDEKEEEEELGKGGDYLVAMITWRHVGTQRPPAAPPTG